MTHFGLICPTASGHLNPMTTLGYELKQRGHKVTLVGTVDAKAKVLAAGLEFYMIGETEFPAGESTGALAQLGQLEGLDAFRYTVDLFKRIATMLLNEVPGALKDLGVEALLIDQSSFGGATIAELLDIPFISVCCAMMLNSDPNAPPFNMGWTYHPAMWARIRNQLGYSLNNWLAKPITKIVADYRLAHGLEPFRHPNDTFSKLAQICQQPPEFEYPRQFLPSSFHFTGPFSNPASREPAPQYLTAFLRRGLQLRSLGLRQLPPRKLPDFFVDQAIKSYPEGYQLSDIGPVSLLNSLNEEMPES